MGRPDCRCVLARRLADCPVEHQDIADPREPRRHLDGRRHNCRSALATSCRIGHPLGVGSEPVVVHCHTFTDCQAVGDAFKENPVVDMLLSGTSAPDAQRLKDFASGLVSAAGGTLEGIGPERFRLSSGPDTGPSADREPREPKPTPRPGAATAPFAGD